MIRTWHPINRIAHAELPAGLRDWILDESSLTRRLKQICPDRFQVLLAEQAWRRPFSDEARILRLHLGAFALVRQVYLKCSDTHLVYARTIIPRRTLQGARRRLAYLGSRPLGDMLFADRSTVRIRTEIASLGIRDPRYTLATGGDTVAAPVLWARRSLFQVGKKPLLVVEVFLPELYE